MSSCSASGIAEGVGRFDFAAEAAEAEVGVAGEAANAACRLASFAIAA